MFRVCRSVSLSWLAGGDRVPSGIESSYTPQALSRTIFASETPMRRKKKSPTFLECQACYRDTAKTVRSVMIPQLFRRCHQDAAA